MYAREYWLTLKLIIQVVLWFQNVGIISSSARTHFSMMNESQSSNNEQSDLLIA